MANCPICKHDKFDIEIQRPNGNYMKCSHCQLVSRAPLLKVSQYTNDDSYRDYMFRETSMYHDFEKKILQIKKFKQSGTLLDVGCNYGILMKVAQDYGYTVSGIEPSKQCCNYGKERYGFDIQNGILDKCIGKYDIVVFNHVLEHTIDPVETLKIAYQCLNDNGLVYISFPNYGCEEAQKMKGQWKYLMSHGHNYQFTAQTASQVLLNAGFHVINNPELTDNLVLIGTKCPQGENPQIQLRRFDNGHIDIILPVHNELELTKQFIKTLYATADQPFKLIVINDCSTDGTKAYLSNLTKDLKELHVINMPQNVGFLKSVNAGIRAGKNDYILITNNDIIFNRRGWMSTMKGVTANDDIGATCLEYLHNEVDFGVMSLFMTKRDILHKIGLLDENLAPAQCEDLDLSIRLREQGLKIQQIAIPVSHLNRNGKQSGKPAEELSSRNIRQIIAKYNYLPKTRKHKIVFHINNQLWIGGIETLMGSLIKYRKRGWEVIVASPQDGRMSKEMQDYGAKVFIGSFQQIFEYMNLIKPNIVHCHNNGGSASYGTHLANQIEPKPIIIETIHSPAPSFITDEAAAVVSVSKDTFGRQINNKSKNN